ncbi:MAG: hypothetical protein HY870_06295 [Chloroflexi bacterium]|nr:hypothetical protein [Chloroflexota bacterium]
MRHVIQKTVTTTKIISLTITHSESEAAVEYTLIDGADQSNEPIAPAPDQAADERAAIAELPAATMDEVKQK